MTHWKHSSACCGKKIAGTANFAELAGLAPILARAVGAALDRRDPTLTPGVYQGLGHAADRGHAHHALALGAPANGRGPRAIQGQEVAHSPSAGPHHAANATTRRQLNSLPLRVQPISGFFAMSKLVARAFGPALCATYNESSQTESYQSAGPPRAPLGRRCKHQSRSRSFSRSPTLRPHSPRDRDFSPRRKGGTRYRSPIRSPTRYQRPFKDVRDYESSSYYEPDYPPYAGSAGALVGGRGRGGRFKKDFNKDFNNKEYYDQNYSRYRILSSFICLSVILPLA
uniref:Uncharacterized protein n=1 Tax=Timema shepardi TaxID=629360 RepID=A0A7R9FWB7_TIMSH|nr:unnamed protein product [Timema shepardi]